ASAFSRNVAEDRRFTLTFRLVRRDVPGVLAIDTGKTGCVIQTRGTLLVDFVGITDGAFGLLFPGAIAFAARLILISWRGAVVSAGCSKTICDVRASTNT